MHEYAQKSTRVAPLPWGAASPSVLSHAVGFKEGSAPQSARVVAPSTQAERWPPPLLRPGSALRCSADV